MRDKKILDIGGGRGYFGDILRSEKITQSVVTSTLWVGETIKKDAVAAVGERLPFQGGSFDLVLSNAAVPQIYALDRYKGRQSEIVGVALEEIYRVLRDGGESRLSFVVSEVQPHVVELFEIVIKELECFESRHPNAKCDLKLLYTKKNPLLRLQNGRAVKVGEYESQHHVLIIKK